MKESMEELKFTTLNDCGMKLLPQAISNFWGFSNQQNKIRNSVMSACEVARQHSQIWSTMKSMWFLTFMLLS
jgi:hypothetical protein